MVTIYKRTQIGYFLLTVYMSVSLFFAFLTQKTKNKPLALLRLNIMLLVLVLLGTLTVEVNGRWLKLRFGIGIIHKEFHLQDIETCRIVKNPWYYGWGIRYTPHGWLFNVSGLAAVEIQLQNGKTYRIGTDEPEALVAALETAKLT